MLNNLNKNLNKYTMMKDTVKIFSIALLSSALSIGGYKYLNTPKSESANNHLISKEKIPVKNTAVYNENNTTLLPNFEYAAEHTVNSVVHVKVEITEKYRTYNPFEQFFGGGNGVQSQERKHQGSGSGVIISNDGYIVTNNHVINNADKIEITLNNKETYLAELVGADPSTDIALLKIDETNLPFVSFSNSNNLKLGEWVIAVGNPFNLTSTVTAGIISAKARNINILQANPEKDVFPVESFIQTDAAVNPGNSGGALVNTKGELVGINTAIASQTGSFTGYSFAVPSNLVSKVTNDLKLYGSVQRAFLGVSIQNINDEIEEELSLQSKDGVYITGLSENSSAKQSGIKNGDIIVSIDDVKTHSVPELQEKIASYIPGDVVKVVVIRDNKLKTFNVELTNKRGTTEIIKKSDRYKLDEIGVTFSNVENKDFKGVEISEVTNLKLNRIGVKKGFVIQKIDHETIKNITDVKTVLESKSGAVLIEGYYPGAEENELAFAIVLP